jgi:predicted transcriptional regulator
MVTIIIVILSSLVLVGGFIIADLRKVVGIQQEAMRMLIEDVMGEELIKMAKNANKGKKND